jgi:short-subunit dehydrogenase
MPYRLASCPTFVSAGINTLDSRMPDARAGAFMKYKLKPVSEQTIVITGASSGIGLVTARMAAAKGARLMLAARQEDSLQQLTKELNSLPAGQPNGQGGSAQERAAYVAADVRNKENVHKIAQVAIEKFGGFDTWVNDAGLSVYGLIRDVPVEDEQEVFAVNFWGSVYGMRTALEHLKQKGGAIINVGSEASEHWMPLQAAYTASKHALKAYTNSLRIELEHDKIPISVTLVKPTGIATPFFEHARNYMKEAPSAPSPMFAPELVAEAILYAAEHHTRDFLVGESALINTGLGKYAPKLHDRIMQVAGFKGQKSSRTAKAGENQALEHASGTLKERGDYEVTVLESSAYNKAKKHPVLAGAIAAAASVAVTAALWPRHHNK